MGLPQDQSSCHIQWVTIERDDLEKALTHVVCAAASQTMSISGESTLQHTFEKGYSYNDFGAERDVAIKRGVDEHSE